MIEPLKSGSILDYQIQLLSNMNIVDEVLAKIKRLLLTFNFGKKLTVSFVLNLTEILTDRKGKPVNSLASPSTKYRPDRFRFVLNKILSHSYQR